MGFNRYTSYSYSKYYCYGPGVNSVTVTKERPPGSGGLYGTSGTMGRGVAESYS